MFGDKKQIEFDILADAASSYSADIARQVMDGFANTMSVSFANNEVFEEIGAKYLSESELMQKTSEFNMRLDELSSDAVHSIKDRKRRPVRFDRQLHILYGGHALHVYAVFRRDRRAQHCLEEKENITYYRMKVLGVTYFQMMVSKMVVVYLSSASSKAS